jgi:uncharacterized flavoprotein (TIGR03862 family)
VSIALSNLELAIVGGGPAGLMAAQRALERGIKPVLFERMGSPARKFLIAGVGGLNLTHAEAQPEFLSRYQVDARESDEQQTVSNWIRGFGATELRQFARDLGVETSVGSSQRVFPHDFKAAPMMRAWLRRLKAQGLRIECGQRLINLQRDGAGWQLEFASEHETLQVDARSVVLALGGGSWSKLGSDGAWLPLLRGLGVDCFDLLASNCGFECHWSEHVKQHAGAPLKPVALFGRKGELMLSEYGLEGSLLYAFSHTLRGQIDQQGYAELAIDLIPDLDLTSAEQRLSAQPSKRSMSEKLKRAFSLSDAKLALFYEQLSAQVLKQRSVSTQQQRSALQSNSRSVAERAKALPIRITTPRAIDEAISTAGGVALSQLTPTLMHHTLPGLFFCGEMLSWDAPTGGYLLTACFASGSVAGLGAADYLERS